MTSPGKPDPRPLWREEFSVDAGEERYVARRQLAKFLVLTSLAMLAGNLWIVVKSWLRKTPRYPATPVLRIGELPVGGVRLFRYPTDADPCILLRLSEDVYAAYGQKCTHLSCAVFWAPEGRRLECPCHEGAFAGEDGRVLQGPPARPLTRVVLERRGGALVAVGMAEG